MVILAALPGMVKQLLVTGKLAIQAILARQSTSWAFKYEKSV